MRDGDPFIELEEPSGDGVPDEPTAGLSSLTEDPLAWGVASQADVCALAGRRGNAMTKAQPIILIAIETYSRLN